MIEIEIPACLDSRTVQRDAKGPCPLCARHRDARLFAAQHPQLSVIRKGWPLIVGAQTEAAEVEFRLMFSDVF